MRWTTEFQHAPGYTNYPAPKLFMELDKLETKNGGVRHATAPFLLRAKQVISLSYML